MTLSQIAKYRAFKSIIERASAPMLPMDVKASSVQSVQKRFEDKNSDFYWWSLNAFGQAADTMPPIGTQARDLKMRELWPCEPILAGTIYVLESRSVALGWKITGKPPADIDEFTGVLQNAEDGAGWSQLFSKWVEDTLTTDNGAVLELGRAGKTGPVSALYNMDSCRCVRTGNPDKPIQYTNMGGTVVDMPVDNVVAYASMPSPDERRLSGGVCFVSRALRAAKLLLALHQYEEDRLRAMPPRGIATVTGMTMDQVSEAMKLYQARQMSKDLTFPGLLWLAGNPFAQGGQVGVKVEPFGNLPENFDRREVMETYAKTLALNAGLDVGEIWLVQHEGATKATGEIQAAKARGKGMGEIITVMERIVNWHILPEGLSFEFDLQNDEEDMYSVQLRKARVDALNAMYAQPNGMEPIISKSQYVELAIAEGALPEDFKPEKVEVGAPAASAVPASTAVEKPAAGGEATGAMPSPDTNAATDTTAQAKELGGKSLEDELAKMPEWKRVQYKKRLAAFGAQQGQLAERKSQRFLAENAKETGEPAGGKERGWFADNVENPHVPEATAGGTVETRTAQMTRINELWYDKTKGVPNGNLIRSAIENIPWSSKDQFMALFDNNTPTPIAAKKISPSSAEGVLAGIRKLYSDGKVYDGCTGMAMPDLEHVLGVSNKDADYVWSTHMKRMGRYETRGGLNQIRLSGDYHFDRDNGLVNTAEAMYKGIRLWGYDDPGNLYDAVTESSLVKGE